MPFPHHRLLVSAAMVFFPVAMMSMSTAHQDQTLAVAGRSIGPKTHHIQGHRKTPEGPLGFMGSDHLSMVSAMHRGPVIVDAARGRPGGVIHGQKPLGAASLADPAIGTLVNSALTRSGVSHLSLRTFAIPLAVAAQLLATPVADAAGRPVKHGRRAKPASMTRSTSAHSAPPHRAVSYPSHPTAPPPSPSPSPASMVLGYYVPGQQALSDLQAHANQITAVAPFWYSLKTNGVLNDMGSSASLTAWCVAHHIAVYPMVINGYGNDNILQNPAYYQQDLSALTNLAATSGYSGLNIDFESLNNSDQQPFDRFIASLAAALHREGKKLIVSVGPRTSDQNNYHVYDYRSLGASADYIDLMLYDQHDIGSAPGPVAGLSWTQSILNYARQTIPASKILVGLAGYGYNWASTGTVEVNDNQALALAQQYGAQWNGGTTQEPEVTYTTGGVQHTVWFEDSWSEALKAHWVGQYHLGGVALWDLGEENPGVWPMLKSTLP